MSASNFPEYAHILSEAIESLLAGGEVTLVRLEIDQRSMRFGYIAGVLQFEDDSTLHFREFIDAALPEPRVMYAYHYQDAENVMIFRYDNAPHKPALPRLEHKHTPTGVVMIAAPQLLEVIDEILQMD
ncbi:MAG: hypothetical protein GXP42_02460 [Chloroflexi bacterium]|nr:hypothetical protein [Chloroflexota bacterium]